MIYNDNLKKGDKVVLNRQYTYDINGYEYYICVGTIGIVLEVDYQNQEAQVDFAELYIPIVSFNDIEKISGCSTPEKYVSIKDIKTIFNKFKTAAWDKRYLSNDLIDDIIKQCQEKSIYK